jgi:dynein heavy chain
MLEDLIARTPDGYNMLVINEKVKDKTPFLVVCLQECERMNSLLEEIVKTLNDLGMGLSGALNMTD